MPRRRDPVPRAKAAGHWLAGILVLGFLGGGVVSAAVLLWENLDVRQLAPGLATDPGPLPLPRPPGPPGAEDGGFDVALFRSGSSETFFPDERYYGESLSRWSGLIEGVGGRVRLIHSDAEVDSLATTDLLVVVDSPCLSDDELSAVRAHLRRGGSLVSNWAVGARDAECEWRGWQAIGEITGAADVRELAVREALYLTVPAGTPLSPGLDPGARIELIPEPSLALYSTDARVYWSDWALNPAPDESGGGADVAALATMTPGGGRTSWFGFRLAQSATRADSARMHRLVENGVRWAAGMASAALSPWPGGRRSALMITEDVEAEYLNASAMAELLLERSVRGTFFPVSQLVMDEPGLAETLASAGEVGAQTSDHQPVAGLTLEDQSVRLRRSWMDIRGWTGVPPAGLRPPEEAYDENTLRAWREAGGSYVLAVNDARSASPEVHDVPGGEMVVLPRLIKDDYNVFVQDGAMRAERLTEAFVEGIAKIHSMGGLAVVALHSQIVGAGPRLGAVRTVLDQTEAQGDWWTAEGAEVAAWWRARAATDVTVVPPEAPPVTDTIPPVRTVGVSIRAGPEPVIDAWLELVLPGYDLDVVAPLVDDEPVPYSRTDWGLRIPLGDLAAGTVRQVQLIEREG